MKTVRVVAADDSAVMRSLLARLFAVGDGEGAPVELCAATQDGATCVKAVRALEPDVVVLDLEMPGLSGLETIAKLRREWPELPIIMCSAYTERGATATLEALAQGATDYVMKPRGQANAETAIAVLREELLPKIVALASRQHKKAAPVVAMASPGRGEQAKVVGIGVSTGGPSALEVLLPALPKDFAMPVLIVQHMPKLFTQALAERLDRCCALRVRLGFAGAEVLPGTVWLAPGDSHMEVAGAATAARLVLHQEAAENHCRPAVDPLFRSLARVFGKGALGLVMTGMGSDGLEGAREIVRCGGAVLAQDEASSAVWGMPGRVAAAGIAAGVLPLSALAEELVARTAVAGARVRGVEREWLHGVA